MTRDQPNNLGEVILYRVEDGKTALDVRLAGETVWLTQAQMVKLFGRDQSVISRHVNSVFKERELDQKSSMQKMHIAKSDKPVVFYSLDLIVSVGYRVKSREGVRFRQWATRTLKDYLIRGYTLNERRLREKGLTEAEQAIQLLSRTLTQRNLVSEEGRGVLDVVSRYAKSWLLLKEYDENRLSIPKRRRPARVALDHPSTRAAIAVLKTRLAERGEATELFGRERGDQLAGILGSIEQTFGGEPLYPSIEEKAAHLLYFVIKDHPFTDGNKRIGSFLFILFLRENGYLTDASGSAKINDNALVALALLMAESDPSHKDLMVRLIMNLLADAPHSA